MPSSASSNGTRSPTAIEEVKLNSSTPTSRFIKNELSSNNDSKEGINNDVDAQSFSPILNYCICCQVKNSSKFMLPQSTGLNEINALLSFCFNRIKTWVINSHFFSILYHKWFCNFYFLDSF